jgi:hypothetical protein
VGKPEGKRLLGKTRRMWMDSNKIDLRGIGWSGMDWIDVHHDRTQCRVIMNAVINLRVP